MTPEEMSPETARAIRYHAILRGVRAFTGAYWQLVQFGEKWYWVHDRGAIVPSTRNL